MPSEPQELNLTPTVMPCVNEIAGEASTAVASDMHAAPLALTPGGSPSRSVTFNEDANVIQIFSPWGKAVLSESVNLSALEKQNYMDAVLSLDHAENILQDGEDAFDRAYDNYFSMLQSGFRFANENVKNNHMGVALTPYIKNISGMQTAVNSAHEEADAAWEALQLSVDEIPVLLSTTTNGAGAGDSLASNVADAHELLLSNHAGVVPTGDFCRLGSAIDDSDDDEATMLLTCLLPAVRTNSFDGDDAKVLLPPLFFEINSYDDCGLELSEDARSEEFDIVY